MNVVYKNVKAVAYWKWSLNDDTCGICRNPFDGACAQCIEPEMGDGCSIVLGGRNCSHAFHMHCIEKWLASDNQVCPMCRRDW